MLILQVVWFSSVLINICFSFILEIFLDGEQWNDGLLATIRERVWLYLVLWSDSV